MSFTGNERECATRRRYREPFTRSPLPDELDAAVHANDAYRATLYTDTRSPLGARTQQVAMAIGYGRDAGTRSIGWERHVATTQYFALVEGSGTLYTNVDSSDVQCATTRAVGPGSKWIVPAGTYHDVVGRFKALIIYFPPKHVVNTYHETRYDAERAMRAEAVDAASDDDDDDVLGHE